jgi:acetyl esterase/lipase
MVLRDDPRADPRVVAALEPFGMTGAAEPPPVEADAPIEAVLEFLAAAETGFEGLFTALSTGLPPITGVSSSVEVITGVDGNEITLYVHRPDGVEGSLPGVLHLHGGSMVILEAAGPLFTRWREELAAAGLVVVGVEFRNGAGKRGPHPFPAGLDDCASALQWVSDNRERLGISKLIVSGESGGGNLSLATALKAKRDGRLEQIDGVYATCPQISNAYTARPPQLRSLYENNGYFMDCSLIAVVARAYDPGGAHAADPLAWPYHASTPDLAGLPPHVIAVNELDPLRDEGLAYFRMLLDAGVPAVGKTINGTTHAGDVMFRAAIADVFLATIRDIAGFAHSL